MKRTGIKRSVSMSVSFFHAPVASRCFEMCKSALVVHRISIFDVHCDNVSEGSQKKTSGRITIRTW